ncbi:hypothetical protein FI667_g16888, partial [Globisporangium splendens]
MQAAKDPSHAQLDTTQQLLHKWTQQLLHKWTQHQPQVKVLLTPKSPAAACASALSRIEICSVCQDHRIEKVFYENMVLDRTCSKCDDEGVVYVRRQEQVPMTEAQESQGDSQKQQVQSA